MTTDTSNTRPSKRPRTRSPPPTTVPLSREDDVATTRIDSTSTQSLEQEQLLSEERYRIYETISEEYHDILSELPLEYARTLNLIHELEGEQLLHQSNFKQQLQRYLSSSSRRDGGGEGSMKGKMKEELEKSLELAKSSGEDKVNLALSLYEAVDRHIQRLDSDLALYDDTLTLGLRQGTQPSQDAPSLTTNNRNTTSPNRGGIGKKEEDSTKEGRELEWSKVEKLKKEEEKKNKHKKNKNGAEKEDKVLESVSVEDRNNARLGMPIDPNEPTYCYCNQVSFGDMIACENDDCPREWFHLGCVGLEKAPVGDWYCDDCKRSLGIAIK